PRLDAITTIVRNGVPDGAWIKVLAVVVWLAWAELAVSIAADVVGRLRGRAASRRRGIGWAQEVAGKLVGAVVLVGGLFGSAPHPTAAAPAPSLATALVAVAAPAQVVDRPATPLIHVVAPGESLSSIARDELGDPAAWPTLWEANHDRAF